MDLSVHRGFTQTRGPQNSSLQFIAVRLKFYDDDDGPYSSLLYFYGDGSISMGGTFSSPDCMVLFQPVGLLSSPDLKATIYTPIRELLTSR